MDSWYEVVNGEVLEQGDILQNFPITQVTNLLSADSRPITSVMLKTVVILTQTCDIPKPAQPTVLFAEIESYDKLAKSSAERGGRRFREKLVEGVVLGAFLLHEHRSTPALPWSIASFRNLHVSPKAEVIEFAAKYGDRLRLASPYKEHLSQSYARFMMRVGLPTTADSFPDYKPPT